MGSFDQRRTGALPSPGPFLAEITSLLDPTYMGGIEVVLKKGLTGSITKQSNTYIVKYLSPFYGATSVRYEGNNSGDFNDVQKSYGMWMVPPDVGTTVMVIFLDGDPNQGYWIGCVPDEFQNHMVPGIAATENVMATSGQRIKYETSSLPTAEFHKSSQKLSNPNVNKFPKPIHPFADRLLAQGLLRDNVRGITSSSARREHPSHVFGISTPGPLDLNGKKGKVGYEGNKQAPISRLGGSTFVMDDGDSKGLNELVRIRTRTGHQILMHNSSDLIYIANSKGTAWIELTSNGKIDIYAEDSVSIHTEADFNFRADRDINIEAGRNINMNSVNNLNINARKDFNLIVNKEGKILINGTFEQTVKQNLKVSVTGGIYQSSKGNINLNSDSSVNVTSAANMNLKASGAMNQSSGANFNVNSAAQYLETAAVIQMNGALAALAIPATAAEISATPTLLPLFTLPNRDKDAGWTGGNFYSANSITSIMQRVPTHEPWGQHENLNPTSFSPTSTDTIDGTANKRAG
jgi:uncharacterized protein (DUF2345 family)